MTDKMSNQRSTVIAKNWLRSKLYRNSGSIQPLTAGSESSQNSQVQGRESNPEHCIYKAELITQTLRLV